MNDWLTTTPTAFRGKKIFRLGLAPNFGVDEGGVRAAMDRGRSPVRPQYSPQASSTRARSRAPSVGAAFSMQGGHWLMHAGQWAVVRRQLGREPIF